LNNWNARRQAILFDMVLKVTLRQEFGEQDAARKFEAFCKWFLENDPERSRTVDKVWLWDESVRSPSIPTPHKPRPDRS
jgi:hypothetical protein